MASTQEFCELVRSITRACNLNGLKSPSFRTPPRAHDKIRTMRRYDDKSVQVAVRIFGRPVADVQADLIEGVIIANDLSGEMADQMRKSLLPPAPSHPAAA